MQIITAILAIAGAAAALPGGGQGDNSYPPSYGNGDPNAYSGPVCVTKSTCNAVYFTTTKQMPYKDTVTVTKTAYKPKVFTTYVPNAYVTTKYLPSAYTVTKHVPVVKTVTVPDHSTKVVCKTITIPFNRTSTHATYQASLFQETTQVPKTAIISSYVPKVVTKKSAFAYKTVITNNRYSASVCTESSSTCSYATSCSAQASSSHKNVYPASDPPVYQPPSKPTYKA
ncbi:hypothetical protein SMMN14_06636 [Sphaerulina musiva]